MQLRFNELCMKNDCRLLAKKNGVLTRFHQSHWQLRRYALSVLWRYGCIHRAEMSPEVHMQPVLLSFTRRISRTSRATSESMVASTDVILVTEKMEKCVCVNSRKERSFYKRYLESVAPSCFQKWVEKY